MREGSRYAFLFDDLCAVTLCGTFFSVMHFIALLCWCLREASRKEGVPKNASCCAACNMVFGKPVFQKIESFIAKRKWYRKQKVVVFPKKTRLE